MVQQCQHSVVQCHSWEGKLGFAPAAVVSFQPQPAANSRTSLLQRHLSALGPNTPLNNPFMLSVTRDSALRFHDNVAAARKCLWWAALLVVTWGMRAWPWSDVSRAEKSPVGDKQTGGWGGGKNDVMSDKEGVCLALARCESLFSTRSRNPRRPAGLLPRPANRVMWPAANHGGRSAGDRSLIGWIVMSMIVKWADETDDEMNHLATLPNLLPTDELDQ